MVANYSNIKEQTIGEKRREKKTLAENFNFDILQTILKPTVTKNV